MNLISYSIIQNKSYNYYSQLVFNQMSKQTQQPTPTFEAIIKNVNSLLEQEQFAKSFQILQDITFEDIDQNVQVMCLKGYILILQKNYQKALTLFDQCLKKRPYHSLSKKRRALVFQKLGEYEQSLKEFQMCLCFQPESKSIRNKIKRLSMGSAKSESISSQGNTNEQKSIKNQKISVNLPEKSNEQKKQKSLNVKFGNFQIIDITGTEDSDERFAIIKEQISRLSDKKPKKSILKDSKSTSILKQKGKQKQEDDLSNSQKIQNVEQKIMQIQKQPNYLIQKIQKSILKKKSKSVTFKGDTNLQDFN